MSRISFGNGKFLEPTSPEAVKEFVESNAASGMIESPDAGYAMAVAKEFSENADAKIALHASRGGAVRGSEVQYLIDKYISGTNILQIQKVHSPEPQIRYISKADAAINRLQSEIESTLNRLQSNTEQLERLIAGVNGVSASELVRARYAIKIIEGINDSIDKNQILSKPQIKIVAPTVAAFLDSRNKRKAATRIIDATRFANKSDLKYSFVSQPKLALMK